jgi:hypothetical protein
MGRTEQKNALNSERADAPESLQEIDKHRNQHILKWKRCKPYHSWSSLFHSSAPASISRRLSTRHYSPPGTRSILGPALVGWERCVESRGCSAEPRLFGCTGSGHLVRTIFRRRSRLRWKRPDQWAPFHPGRGTRPFQNTSTRRRMERNLSLCTSCGAKGRPTECRSRTSCA